MRHMPSWKPCVAFFVAAAMTIGFASFQASAQQKKAAAKKAAAAAVVRDEDLPWPPALPNGEELVTDTSPDFLKAPETLLPGVTVAKTAPTVDFIYFQNQNYPGKPWSNWGDGSVANGKYYTAIGDHIAIGRAASINGTGTGHVYEYDPATKKLRSLVDVTKLLNLPEGHYTPGKIHSRVDMGKDGWLYYATHRGSPAAASDANHYKGDWIFRTNPQTGESEVVVQGPVPKHSTPNSVLDPERMIFYGGTAHGPDAEIKEIVFFAYDVVNRKLLYSGPGGPARYMILAKSTGRLYFVPGAGEGPLMRFDPKTDKAPVPVGIDLNIRAATDETEDGLVYCVGLGQGAKDAEIFEFNTKTEKARVIGTVAVGTNAYVASIDVDPTGRYLYYIPGAHGGSERDNSAVVQYDVKTNTKKIIAFLHPFYEKKYGLIPKGTYSTAVSPEGDKLYVTWNVSRGTRAWDCCGLTVIHIPESERQP